VWLGSAFDPPIFQKKFFFPNSLRPPGLRFFTSALSCPDSGKLHPCRTFLGEADLAVLSDEMKVGPALMFSASAMVGCRRSFATLRLPCPTAAIVLADADGPRRAQLSVAEGLVPVEYPSTWLLALSTVRRCAVCQARPCTCSAPAGVQFTADRNSRTRSFSLCSLPGLTRVPFMARWSSFKFSG